MFIAPSLEKVQYVSGSPNYEMKENLNYEKGLLRVKNYHEEKWSDEYLDGYETALEMFEEAEDL